MLEQNVWRMLSAKNLCLNDQQNLHIIIVDV